MMILQKAFYLLKAQSTMHTGEQRTAYQIIWFVVYQAREFNSSVGYR